MKRSLGRKTLIQPAPVWVIATYDEQGKPNAMAASWAGICCSKPPAVCVSLREATYTYHAIKARKAFTVNLPSCDHAVAADFLGIASGRDIDKLAVAGLTPVRAEQVDAPLIEEFPLNLECALVHEHTIGLHTLFVGEILDVKADEGILNDKGRPAIDLLRPFVYAVAEGVYRSIGETLGSAFDIGNALTRE